MAKEINFNSEMQELANLIAPYAPNGWERMNVSFETYAPGDYGIDIAAVVGGANTPVDIEEGDVDALEKIFTAIKEKTIAEWRIAHFYFTVEGDCEITFEY